MIINHEYGFIFVKTRKTAGTSIEYLLASLCEDGDTVTPIFPHVNGFVPRNYQGFFNPFSELGVQPFGNMRSVGSRWIRRQRFFSHMPARLIQARIDADVWNSYFKFTVERHPYDKVVSHYSWLRYTGRIADNFDSYIHSSRLPVDHPLYVDHQNQILVDRIISFETMEEDLRDVLNYLNVPDLKRVLPHTKGEGRSESVPIEPYKDQIKSAFAWEFRNLGFDPR